MTARSTIEKLPVCYGEGIAPYCPRCRSGEYLHKEDGNENNFCGQCGCPLDWTQMWNEDTEQTETQKEKRCEDCTNLIFCEYGERGGVIGYCKKKRMTRRGSKRICRHFKNRILNLSEL